ncbi:MAG TPA: glycosyltransferase family 2 protein [Candidatus Omnitrophota bacterium]|nr:glycosyltransferase family 2 protein [Candidatus Omnitrophota bacterium]
MNNPLISIIVPTYNEAQNINELLNRVHAALNGIEHEIIVVDDDSPDKTWEIAENRSKADSWVRVIRRKDRGLSKAVVAGFNEAKGELLGVIDADLQHDERILPEMIKKIEVAPIVVGSRYVEGGGVGDWKLDRKIKSWLATKVAALILNVSVNDPMAGFFIVKKDVYQRVKEKVNPQGFKILLEILYHANVAVAEVPYQFRTRLAGESKLSSKVVIEYFKQVIRLRSTNPVPEGLIKYSIVGGSGVLVDMLAFGISSHFLKIPVAFSGIISSQVAIFTNFILNDVWTFESQREQPLYVRFAKYEATCFIGIIIKFFVILLTVNIFRFNPYLANGIGIILVVFSNFIFSKLWVWKTQK